jgi:hypothetical protein
MYSFIPVNFVHVIKFRSMKLCIPVIVLFLSAGTFLFCPITGQSQTAAKVENIDFYAEGSKLVITYDIAKAKPDETFDIWFKIVTDSDKEINPVNFTGDASSGVTGGMGKKIIWDVGADKADLSEAFSVEVFARMDKKTDKIVPSYNPVTTGSLSARDVFLPEKNSFTWLGIDYSHVQLNCEAEPNTVKSQYFAAWNKLVLDEADKYNIKRMLKLKSIQNDISMIGRVNQDANTSGMKSESAPNYTAGDIASFVGSYNPQNKSGIGIVFIAEFLGKAKKQGVFHVVALNLANNEVLVSERMTSEPGGAGFRNFWAGSVYKIILEFEKNYKNLKTKYSK